MIYLLECQAEMKDLIFFLMESMCSRFVIACCLQNPAPYFEINSEVANSEVAGTYCRAPTVGWHLLLRGRSIGDGRFGLIQPRSKARESVFTTTVIDVENR